MNSHLLSDDLLDLWVKKEITRDELYGRAVGKDLDQVDEIAEMHFLAVETLQQYGIRNDIALAHQRYLSFNNTIATSPARVVSFNTRKWLITVTSAAALFAGVYFSQAYLFSGNQKMYQQSFQEYYINTERSNQNVQAGHLTESFKNQDFQGVVAQYSLLVNKTNRERFLAAYAQLKLENHEVAINLFQQILNDGQKSGETLYMDEAEYYLALTYLKTGDTDNAHRLFKTIFNNKEHTFNEAVSSWMLFRLKWIN